VSTYNKFKKGLLIAASSFNLIWKNKKLLVYLGIPLIFYVVLEILIFNISSTSACFFSQKNLILKIFKITGPHKLISYVKVIIATLIYLATINFGYIALTYHTTMLAHQKKKISIREVILAALAHIKPALIWTLLLIIPTVIFYVINAYNQNISSSFVQLIYIMFILALLAAWSLVTSFVIQAITVDNLDIIASIKKSIYVIKQSLVEFFGTVFWLGLISTLSATPFMLLEKYANIFYIITIPLVLLIYCTMTSAYTVAKTLLYLDFKKG